MTIETEIESMLKKWLGLQNVTTAQLNEHGIKGLASDLTRLMEREPRKEELDMIFEEETETHKCSDGGGRCVALTQYHRLKHRIMSWAKSEPSKRWCSHCVWHDSEDNFQTDGYYYCSESYAGKRFPVLVRKEWDSCPICGSPRPSERGR